jgi:NAD(P)-dependent dehydrogenase (short-subunit alcohol dehydrogenase family)
LVLGFKAEYEEVMAVDVLVTGGDTELGRAVAEGFRDAGHAVTLAGARRDDLEVAAKELDADAIVCDNTDPASLAEARGLFPHHLDTIVNVPAPRWDASDPRTYSLSDLACAWRNALDVTVLSAVLTVETVGDHLRSGGSIVSVVAENPRAGSADAAVKAALSNWVAGQATVFGTRGITVNTVAAGRGVQPGYEGLASTPPPVAAEVARLALFLTSPAARHITGQMLHVSQGALAQFA